MSAKTSLVIVTVGALLVSAALFLRSGASGSAPDFLGSERQERQGEGAARAEPAFEPGEVSEREQLRKRASIAPLADQMAEAAADVDELDPLLDRQAWFNARKEHYRDWEDSALLGAKAAADAKMQQLTRLYLQQYRAENKFYLVPNGEELDTYLKPLPKTDAYPVLELGFSQPDGAGDYVNGVVFIDPADHDDLRHALDEMGVLNVLTKDLFAANLSVK